jgi:multiple sugar transport system substrate-binding protein
MAIEPCFVAEKEDDVMTSVPCPSWRRSRVVLLALAILVPMLAMSLGTPAVIATQSDEPITLNLWIFEGEEQLLPALEEAFEAEQPNINLEITLIPEDQYAVKIDTALAAGSPPDIGFLYEQRWVKAGQILPLDDMIAAEGIELADFNQAVLDGWCLFEGHVYCIGSYIGATVLIYNKAMFDAAGLEYPSATEPLTIDEYAALAEQLTVPSDDVTQVVWGGTAEPPYWWLDPRGMFSEDGRQIEGYVNDDATKHAYDVLTNMVIEGYAPSGSVLQTMGDAGSEDLLVQGKLAMEIGASSEFRELEAAGIDYGVAPIPVEQEGDPVHVSVWTDGFSVFNGSAHPEEAKAFLGFLATEGQRLRVEVTGEPPLSAAAAAEYGWVEQGNVEGRQEFLQAISAADPGIFIPSFFDVVLPLEDAFNLMVEGEATSAVLDEVAPRMQDSLDQNWETWEQFSN